MNKFIAATVSLITYACTSILPAYAGTTPSEKLKLHDNDRVLIIRLHKPLKQFQLPSTYGTSIKSGIGEEDTGLYKISSRKHTVLEVFMYHGRVLDLVHNDQMSNQPKKPLPKSDASYAIVNHNIENPSLTLIDNGQVTTESCTIDSGILTCQAELNDLRVWLHNNTPIMQNPQQTVDSDDVVFSVAFSNYNNYYDPDKRTRKQYEHKYVLKSEKSSVPIPPLMRKSYPYKTTLDGVNKAHTLFSQKPTIFALTILQNPKTKIIKQTQTQHNLDDIQLVEGLPLFISQKPNASSDLNWYHFKTSHYAYIQPNNPQAEKAQFPKLFKIQEQEATIQSPGLENNALIYYTTINAQP
jgi:hypothetical protein